MQTPLLEGRVGPSELDRLRQENDSLRQRIEELSRDVHEARGVLVGVDELRRVLTPLYRALQNVFGEAERLAGSPISRASSGDPKSEVWEAWKQKLGQNCSKIISALQVHGQMNTTQLSIATGIRRSNIPRSIYDLNRAGLINKNGGVFSLKQL